MLFTAKSKKWSKVIWNAISILAVVSMVAFLLVPLFR
jgi:hypothetical protein